MSDYVPYGTYGQAPPLHLGSVFSRAFGIFERQWPRLLGATLAVTAGAIVFALGLLLAFVLLRATGAGMARPLSLVLTTLGCLGIFATSTGLFGLQLSVSLHDLDGRRADLSFAFWRAIRRVPAAIGLGILSSLMILGGTILLVVPGIIAMMIAVTGSVCCIVEKTGPIESLRRGAHLTRGHRWRLFGFGICCVLIGLLPGVVTFAVRLLLGTAAGGVLAHLLGALLQIAVQWGISTWLGIAGAVVYHDLVLRRDGVATAAIADALEH